MRQLRLQVGYAIVVALAVLICSVGSVAYVPPMIPVQGTLSDAEGIPFEGMVDMTFTLYNDADAGEVLWTDTMLDIDVENGFFTVHLGAGTPLDVVAMTNAAEIWVGIAVDDDEEMPRFQLLSVPFALEALVCENAIGPISPKSISVGGSLIVDETGAWVGNSTGLIGPQGPPGATGADGAVGPQGPTGADGAAGPQGPPGEQGPVGPMGPMGPAGADGAAGPQGSQGLQGAQGLAGSDGVDGIDGISVTATPLLIGDTDCPYGGVEYVSATSTDYVCNGAPGTNGVDGAVGPQGEQGPAGAEGAVGPQGPQGEQGPVGPMGPAGADGADGAMGPQGPQGEQGAVGPMGPAGADGADGAMGPQGPQGEQGAVGPMGPMGPMGADGADGAMGPQGPQGEQGAVGPMGPMGPAGADGADGAMGPQGPQGEQGAVGPMGPMGPAGADGADGPQGEQGPVGPMGPAGADGADGADGAAGPKGEQGLQGLAGNDGIDGISVAATPLVIGDTDCPFGGVEYVSADSTDYVCNGAPGADGTDGAVGPQGAQGPQGEQGPVGPMGPMGPAGSDGADGVDGADGADGAIGPQGPVGPQGSDGADGVSVMGTTLLEGDSNCPYGGVAYVSISGTHFVCNGEPGVDGSIQLSEDTSECIPEIDGTLRYSETGGLEVCNGTDWVAALPKAIMFSGGCTTDTNANGAWTNYCLDGVDFNTTTDYLSIGTGGIITVLKAGFYNLRFSGQAAPAAFAPVQGQIIRNGSPIVSFTGSQGFGVDAVMNTNISWPFNQGDTIAIQFYAGNDSAAPYAWSDTAAQSRLQITFTGN